MKTVWDDGDALRQVWKQENTLIKGRKKMKKHELDMYDLKIYGYNLSKSTKIRHLALGKAIKKYGYRATLQKLSNIRRYSKLTKSLKHKLDMDKKWVKERYRRR